MHRSRRWKKRPNRDGSHQGSPSADQSSGHAKGPRRDLLVFGYASRIFDDDEKARFLDAGRHLIPWMGDRSLLIDRYDCRGHLHEDLQQSQTDATRMPDGTPVGSELYGDEAFEELAEEERYRDFWNSEKEETARTKAQLEFEMEEDYLAATSSGASSPKQETPVASITTAKFGAVPFVYSEKSAEETEKSPISAEFPTVEEETVDNGMQKPVTPPSTVTEKKPDDVEEIPFVPRQNFEIPSHICLPQFERINSIIEKTAQFIAEKGPQLEVVIRTKQANNNSFAFLHPKDMLHPYYMFLVEAFKSGSYKPSRAEPKEEVTKPKSPVPEKKIEEEESEDSDDNEGNYLHPSLLRGNLETAKKIPPKIAAVFKGSTTPSSTLYTSLIQTVQAGNSRSGPSPEIISAINKMVIYIAKNGESFEEMIKNRHGPDDPKFGFVHGYHPYHGLYDEKKRAALANLPSSVFFPNKNTFFSQRNKDHEIKTVLERGTTELEREDVSQIPIEPESAATQPPRSPPAVPLPPPPPPPPAVIKEDPRIAELKKKALEASLKIAERLKERANLVRPEGTVTEGIVTDKHTALTDKHTIEIRKPEFAPPTVVEVQRDVEFFDSETTQKSSVARKPVQADPGSLLELLQIDRTNGNDKILKEENRHSTKKAKRRTSSSSSSSSDGRRRKKSHKKSGKKRSRSSSRDRSRRSRKHRRSRS